MLLMQQENSFLITLGQYKSLNFFLKKERLTTEEKNGGKAKIRVHQKRNKYQT